MTNEQVARRVLQAILEKKGITLRPKGLKKQVRREAKRLELEPYELAQLLKDVIEVLSRKVLMTLEDIE